jgi:uncharacterized membrane protein
MLYLLAFLIGSISGLRTLTAPAAVSWAAWAGGLDLRGGWLWFMGHAASPWVFTAMALAEMVADQLPSTPSRKVPVQFAARLISGALCGGAVGESGGLLLVGGALGVVGAIAGTLGGAAARAWLAKKLGKDRPAAIIEDVVAIGGAATVVALLP